MPNKEKFIELSGDFLDGVRSKSQRIPAKLKQIMLEWKNIFVINTLLQ